MGSFNVGCGISNLSINEGDEIGFVILGKNENKETHGQSYYNYATDLYQAFLAPVYGKYDDYGNITDVEPSLTTEVIENMFHRPVETVLNCISSQHDIYDPQGQIFQQYSNPNKSWEVWEPFSNSAALELGFTHTKGDNDGHDIYTMGDFILVIRTSKASKLTPKGSWSLYISGADHPTIQDSPLSNLGEMLEEFGRITGMYPGFDSSDYDAIRVLNELHGMFFLKEFYDGMKEYALEDKYQQLIFGRLKELWDGAFVMMQSPDEGAFPAEEVEWMTHCLERILRDSSFPIHKFHELRTYGNAGEFLEIHVLNSIMGTVNRMLMPTLCEVSWGDNVASVRMNNISDRILSRRLDASEYA